MTNKEKQVILDTYKNVYNVHHVIKIDKSDTIRELGFMLNMLDLKKEKCMVENEVICERDNIGFMAKEMYSMIFDSFAKYEIFINYDLKEIDCYFDDLQFRMTDEEIKCHNARINYLTERAA